jgi:hypothetical protein
MGPPTIADVDVAAIGGSGRWCSMPTLRAPKEGDVEVDDEAERERVDGERLWGRPWAWW